MMLSPCSPSPRHRRDQAISGPPAVGVEQAVVDDHIAAHPLDCRGAHLAPPAGQGRSGSLSSTQGDAG